MTATRVELCSLCVIRGQLKGEVAAASRCLFKVLCASRESKAGVSVSVVYAATSSSLASTQRKGDRAEAATDVG